MRGLLSQAASRGSTRVGAVVGSGLHILPQRDSPVREPEFPLTRVGGDCFDTYLFGALPLGCLVAIAAS